MTRGSARRRAGVALVAAGLLLVASGAEAAPAGPHAGAAALASAAPDYEACYDQFSALRPDSSRVAPVSSLEIERDAGVVVLEEGQLALCHPVAGRVCAALFEGRGVFSFTPPSAVERAQLERFYGTTSLRRPFRRAVLIFADSTLAELTAAVPFDAAKARHGAAPGEDARKFLRACVRSLTFDVARDVEPAIARSLLEAGPSALFFAAFDTPGTDPVAFEISPLEAEEVRLLRPAEELGRGLLMPRRLEVVCQFRRQADTTAVAASDLRPSVAIRHERLDCTLTSRAAFSARAEIAFDALEDQRWLLLFLDDTLRVRSAEWGDGAPARFRKGENSPCLWVECDPPLERRRSYTLRLRYDGSILLRADDWFFFRSIGAATGWYPRQEPRRGATFDLTFHVAQPMEFVCAGERTSVESADRMTTSHWVIDHPVRGVSFNLGFFKQFQVNDKRIPPVIAMMSSRGHTALTDSLAEEGEAPGKEMEKQVAADVASSLLFFQNRFGPAGAKRFYATETPAAHGEAFPGLIHLSTATFHSPNPGGWDQLFRAHEVAHQWWGVGVGFRTYHDQWLSEAFAEFSALSYLQAASRDNRLYFDRLEKWRKEILGNRKFVFGSRQQAGPIWLGWRTSTSTTPGDYDLIIYEKGAWVLHMLRNLMIDLNTMDEQRFTDLLRDFYQTFQGRDASTEDFQALAEQHAGQDLGWFFDEWVYGTDLPSYRFAWKGERSADGTWKVRCRVGQTNVPEEFRMPVPIQVEFADNKFTKTRVWIHGPVSEFELPPLPLEPKRVIFNDMASVLCEVENVKW